MVEDSLKSTNISGAPSLFCEVQYFRSNRFMILTLAVIFIALAVLLVEIEKLSKRGITPYPLYILVAFILLIFLFTYFMNLKIEVSYSELKFIMIPLMFRAKRHQLSEIEKAEAVSFRPILDFGGWGIRYGKGMWAYNVYGNKGVVVYLKSGKKFLLGTQKAEELARSIMQPL
jgi:hypothetical protein